MPWNPCPPSRGIAAHLPVESVPTMAWNTHKHPDVWRELSSKSFFIDNAVISFIWKKRDRGLDDVELTVVAGHMRRLQLVGMGIWLAYMVALFATYGTSKL